MPQREIASAAASDLRGVGARSLAQIRLLLPVIRAQTVPALLELGDALTRDPDWAGDVLGLVEVPRYRAARLGQEVTERRRDLLRWIAALDERHDWGSGARLGILVRAVHDIVLGIREAVYETGANLLVIEWPGLASKRAHLLARVVDDLSGAPPADLLLVRPSRRPLGRPTGPRILAPVRGGPNAELAVRVAAGLAGAWDGTADLLHLAVATDPAARRRRELEIAATLADSVASDRVRLVQQEVSDVGLGILRAARGCDVVVLGAYAGSGRGPTLVRPELAAPLRQLPGTVILVRTTESLTRSGAEPRPTPRGGADQLA